MGAVPDQFFEILCFRQLEKPDQFKGALTLMAGLRAKK